MANDLPVPLQLLWLDTYEGGGGGKALIQEGAWCILVASLVR